MKRIVLTTGGTGGHIFPALSVAEEIKNRLPEAEVLFIGGLYGQEAELATKAGLKYLGLPVKGFVGRGLRSLGAGFSMCRALLKARSELKKFSPDVVIGFGGYACFASMFAAKTLGIPTVIHEQNSIPGIANRILGRFAKKICISLPDAEKWFDSSKTVLTGNPVRSSIRTLYRTTGEVIKKEAESGTRKVLVLGGSQGAKALNSQILADLHAFRDSGTSLWVQSGKFDFERVAEEVEKYNIASEEEFISGSDCITKHDASSFRLHVAPFVSDMDKAYAWADLVVCRAGATTLAEITVAGLPAVFVPFPYATHNHQLCNAEQMKKVGAAVVLEQKDFAPGKLFSMVDEILKNPAQLASMSEAAWLLAMPNAAASVLNEAAQAVEYSAQAAKSKDLD